MSPEFMLKVILAAKNVVLAGVKSLTVQDHRLCKMANLSTQFFIREDDVEAKKTR